MTRAVGAELPMPWQRWGMAQSASADDARRGQASEADLAAIDAVLRGDVDRYAELVSRYQAAAWRVAYGMIGNLEDAKDVSQTAFVKAYQHLGQFRRTAKFSTWLYRIVVNECKDLFKRASRRPATLSWQVDDDAAGGASAPEPADDRHNPREASQNREIAVRLGEAVSRLSARQREAFVLHHVQGLSIEEAAQVLGCRVGTAKSHLFRACEQLRGELAPYVREIAQ